MIKWHSSVLPFTYVLVFATGLSMRLTMDWATGGSSLRSQPKVGFVGKVADSPGHATYTLHFKSGTYSRACLTSFGGTMRSA